MDNITPGQKSQYLADGYLILKSDRVKKIKDALSADLYNMARRILKNHPDSGTYYDALNSNSFAELFDWCVSHEKSNAITRIFYELFSVNCSTVSLIADPYFLKASRDLGVSYPVPSTLPMLRIDRPNESRYLTPAHQDYWYSMLSANSLTYWFSIFPVTDAMGQLLVVPGSHVHGLLPIKKWTDENPFSLRDEISMDRYVPVCLQDDEVLVFSQFLVHQSGANRSGKARLTLQLRHNDLDTLKEQTTSYTPMHSKYTVNAQKNWLEESKITGK